MRQAAKKRRAELAEVKRDTAQKELARRLLTSDFLEEAGSIGLYASYGSEVATDGIAHALLQTSKVISFPRVVKDTVGLSMSFFQVKNSEELSPGYKGILEPSRDETRVLHPELLVVPGLAFAADGGRLGYGAGTYDRYVGTCTEKPLLVALAFECQVFGEVPTLPHDIYMDIIVTEQRTILCR